MSTFLVFLIGLGSLAFPVRTHAGREVTYSILDERLVELLPEYSNRTYSQRVVPVAGRGNILRIDVRSDSERLPRLPVRGDFSQLEESTPVSDLARRLIAAASGGPLHMQDLVLAIRSEIRYCPSCTEEAPQLVLSQHRGNCVGVANTFRELIMVLGLDARIVHGVLLEPMSSRSLRARLHRWVEVRDDRGGWTFVDPLAARGRVTTDHLVLALEDVIGVEPVDVERTVKIDFAAALRLLTFLQH